MSIKLLVASNSGSVVSSLLDNPCLSRSLLADYSSATCYKQISTTVNKYGGIYVGNTFFGGSILNGCQGDGRAVEINYPVSFVLGEGSVQGYCRLYKTTYTCPSSHPTKLNNSTCEYRESF